MRRYQQESKYISHTGLYVNRIVKSLYLSALLSLAGVQLVRAQDVTGTVYSRSLAPVPGVVVTLLDSAMHHVLRALSDERGKYRLRAVGAGRYTLRAQRIGFAPSTTASFVVGSVSLVRDIALEELRVVLDTTRVAVGSSCPANSQALTPALNAFTQVRTALLAVQLSKATASYDTKALNFDRVDNAESGRVITEGATVMDGAAPAVWLTPPPDVLHRDGFISSRNNVVTYSAPSVEVLLSDEFVADHCFGTLVDENRFGITFKPNKSRRVPEVHGTVWIDRHTQALRSVEFGYESTDEPGHALANGIVQFTALRNGQWIASGWYFRMPVLELRTSGTRYNGGTSVAQTVVVAEWRTAGAELIRVLGNVDTLWTHPPLAIKGIVRDSATGTVVENARVSIDGSTRLARTDSAGQFVLEDLMPGVYNIDVRTPELEPINLSIRRRVTLIDSTISVPIGVLSLSELMGAFCKQSKRASLHNTGVLFGALTADSAKIFDVPHTIEVEWSDEKMAIHRLETRTDDEGRFSACALPLETSLRVRVRSYVVHAEYLDTLLSARRPLARITMPLSSGGQYAAIRGFVHDERGQPLVGADVALVGEETSARTNSTGAFRLGNAKRGTYTVLARKLGFAQSEQTVVASDDSVVTVRFRLPRLTTLDSVTIVENAFTAEFDARRRAGIGRFVTRDELETWRDLSVAAILENLSGTRIVHGTGTHAWLSTGRPRSLTGGDLVSGDLMDRRAFKAPAACYVAVFVNNRLVYGGKDGESLFDLSSIRPEEIEVVEFYSGPAETPAQFMTTRSTCGALVITLRRSP